MYKLILADDQLIYRAGAARLLAEDQDCRLVAQCDNLPKALVAVEQHGGSVVVLGSSLKPELGLLSSLLESAGSRGIVVAENNEPTERYAKAGFKGVVHRDATAERLFTCVRKVSRGMTSIERSRSCMEQKDEVGARVLDRLTRREIEVVGLIGQGLRNKEIANCLQTTEQVIKNYLVQIYNKVGVSDRLELALFTIHHHALAAATITPADGRSRMAHLKVRVGTVSTTGLPARASSSAST